MSLLLYDTFQDPSLIGTDGGYPAGIVKPYSPGGAFPFHNWLEVNGNVTIGLNTLVLLKGATFWFAWKFEGYSLSGTIFQTLGYLSSPPGQKTATMLVKIEADNTLSLYVAGSPQVLFFNSGTITNPYPFVFQPNVWYYFQLDVLLGFQTGEPYFLTAQVDLWIDGFQLVAGQMGTSNFFVGPDPAYTSSGGSMGNPGSFANGDCGFNEIEWIQPNGSGKYGIAETYSGGGTSSVTFPGNLWTLVIDNPGTDYGPLPPNINVSSGDATIGAIIDAPPGGTGPIKSIYPKVPNYLGDSYTKLDLPILLTATPFGTPNGSGFAGHATLAPDPNRRISQAVLEAALLPPHANVRISQQVIEHAYKPKTANIRIPQMVIELPLKRSVAPGGTGGWIVKEC